MKPLLTLWVPGQALPKGSFDVIGFRRGKAYAREKEELYVWQNAVGMVALVEARKCKPRWELIDTATSLEIHYTLQRKRSARPDESCIELAAVKPDIDKCERAILDALQGVIYTQDSRVTSVLHRKRVALHGKPETVGVQIRIGLDTGE